MWNVEQGQCKIGVMDRLKEGSDRNVDDNRDSEDFIGLTYFYWTLCRCKAHFWN